MRGKEQDKKNGTVTEGDREWEGGRKRRGEYGKARKSKEKRMKMTLWKCEKHREKIKSGNGKVGDSNIQGRERQTKMTVGMIDTRKRNNMGN